METKRPVEISILYGSEKKTWLSEQIDAFNASSAKTKQGAPIRVTGKAVGSGEAVTAILAGTEKPVVFSPASGAYITLLDQTWLTTANHTKRLTRPGEPLVLSPIVIAMWKPMAEALGWPDKAIGWADILRVSADPKGWGAFGRPEWGEMKLGHTHPAYSNSGLLTILAIAYGGAKTTRGLTVNDLTKVEPFIAKVEDAIVHYGKSTGFFADKMVERGPSYLSAAVLYENLVIESYAKSPTLPLVAVYPVEGTFWSDHPYSVLDADWVTADQREGADLFLAFLKGKPQQERALALGFRPVDPSIKISAPIDAAHGVDPMQPQTLLEIPDGPTLQAVLDVFARTKKTADIVLVFDKSGSMKGRPLEEAKRGAKAFLATLDARDQVTLLFFDGKVYPPFGPVEVGKAKAELESRIDGVSAAGETALYSATDTAYKLLASRKQASSNRIRAAVVMTDGVDNRSTITDADLLKKLRGSDEAHRVATVFTISYGDAATQAVMKEIASAGAGSFSEGNVDSIIQVYRDLASFF
ncbi:MAG: VWA domain-containing protein [Deltaproteobacteria bacterium]|nr:VWA domain-containing protein [Deltaproteobacteria bacterium]